MMPPASARGAKPRQITAKTEHEDWKQRVQRFLDDPRSSKLARIFAVLMLLFICFSSATAMLEVGCTQRDAVQSAVTILLPHHRPFPDTLKHKHTRDCGAISMSSFRQYYRSNFW